MICENAFLIGLKSGLQEDQLRAGRLNDFAVAGDPAHRLIVADDNIVLAGFLDQYLLDPSAERGAIQWTVQDPGSDNLLRIQLVKQDGGVPVAEGE